MIFAKLTTGIVELIALGTYCAGSTYTLFAAYTVVCMSLSGTTSLKIMILSIKPANWSLLIVVTDIPIIWLYSDELRLVVAVNVKFWNKPLPLIPAFLSRVVLL